jgi:uncharacterized delta-60 repeat protein
MKTNLILYSLLAVPAAGLLTLNLHALPGDLDSLDANIDGFPPNGTGVVHATAVQPDGKIIIGGSFPSVQGGVGPNTIVRLNGDGTLDTSFNLNLQQSAEVNAIALQPDGKVLIGGWRVRGNSNIGRYNVDGLLDEGFDPNPNYFVKAIAVQPDGKVVLGGGFTTLQPNGASTATTRNNIARVNADGTLDTSFDPNPSDQVLTLAMQPDGKVLLAGFFTSLQPDGAATPTTRHYLARVNADGTLDTGFDPNPDFFVECLAVQADGKVVFGGDFGRIQPAGAATPIFRQRLARVNADGSADPGFDPSPDGRPVSIAMLADGSILLGGSFTYFQPNGAAFPQLRSYIASINPDGTLETVFRPNPNKPVHSIAVQADGKVLIGGEFTTLQPDSASTATPRNFFARVEDYAIQQSLSLFSAPLGGYELLWHRAGSTPELTHATFELSQDGGATFGAPVVATRVGTSAEWEILLFNVIGSGVWRARGYTADGEGNGSSSLIEQLLQFGPDRRVAITGLFNTGVDSAGTLLGLYDPDAHYTLVGPPPSTGTPIAATIAGGFPIPPWFEYPNPVSDWINPVTIYASLPGDYVYETTFDLTGMDPSTASLTGRWATDNAGVDILLNGWSTGVTSPDFTSFTPFQIANNPHFIGGINTLTFNVHNDYAAGYTLGENPTGLRVEVTGLASTVRTLTVASSNPNTGVVITVSPNDIHGVWNGTTLFTRDYDDGTVVTLTAPATAGGNTFQKWQEDGVDYATTASTTVTMDVNHTMTAVYVATRTLTVASSNPSSGLGITVSPNDINGLGNGFTLLTRTYNIGAVVTVTAPAVAGGNLFQKWQKDGADLGTTASVSVTMDADHTLTAVYFNPGGTAYYVTGKTLGTPHNSYSGFVGMKITVGANPVTVTALGRLCVSGNTGTHTVKLVKAVGGTDVTGGSVSVAMSGGTAGAFKYGSLSSPVVLAAGATYYVVSQETSGGDQYYGIDTTITTTVVATEVSAAYGSGGGSWNIPGGAGQTYGPVDFQYLSGAVVRTLTVASATPNSGVPITVSPNDNSGVGNGTTLFTRAYNDGTVVTLTAPTTAGGNTFQKWQKDGADLGTTASVNVTMDANHTLTAVYFNPGGAAYYVTGKTLGTPHNSYSGFVGMKITVGANPVTVTALGRLCVSGNTGTHTVKLVKAVGGTDVAGGSVSVAMSGGTAGAFKYASLSSPVVLAAGTSYYVVSKETSGGDQYYGADTTITTTTIATEVSGVYGAGGGAWSVNGGAGQTYGPVDFQYLSGGAVVRTLTVASATPNSGVPITVSPNDNTGAANGTTAFTRLYNDGTGVNLTAPVTAGANTFQKWQKNGADLSTSASIIVTMNADCTLTAVYVPPPNYVTGKTLGTAHNSYSGFVGMKITVGANPVTVTALGRLCVPGNTGTHTVKLVKAIGGTDVTGGSVSVAMSGGTAGAFKYASLSSPVVLAAGTSYYVVSQESSGGDQYYGADTTVTTTAVATEVSGVYGAGGGAWSFYGGAGQTYGPVDFQY